MLYCPCAKTSADGQPDVQPTSRRINHHKTAAVQILVGISGRLLPEREGLPVGGNTHATEDEGVSRREEISAPDFPFAFGPKHAHAVGNKRQRHECRGPLLLGCRSQTFLKRTLLVLRFHKNKRPAATMTCFRRFTRRV